eukprot:6018945-Pyramimonas_sp.AAC.1
MYTRIGSVYTFRPPGSLSSPAPSRRSASSARSASASVCRRSRACAASRASLLQHVQHDNGALSKRRGPLPPR